MSIPDPATPSYHIMLILRHITLHVYVSYLIQRSSCHLYPPSPSELYHQGGYEMGGIPNHAHPYMATPQHFGPPMRKTANHSCPLRKVEYLIPDIAYLTIVHLPFLCYHPICPLIPSNHIHIFHNQSVKHLIFLAINSMDLRHQWKTNAPV